MRKTASSILLILVLLLTACGGGAAASSTPPASSSRAGEDEANGITTGDQYFDQLSSALLQNKLIDEPLSNPSEKNDSDSKLGDYLYRSHILDTGAFTYVCEDLETQEILQVSVYINYGLARVSDNAVEVGGFAMGCMLSMFDSSEAVTIFEELSVDDLSYSRIDTYDSATGTYEMTFNANSGMQFLTYTPN